jgi:hypothetical protein
MYSAGLLFDSWETSSRTITAAPRDDPLIIPPSVIFMMSSLTC